MKAKVSIIIRAKNEEDWIGACIKSVQMQECQNYEIIVVDNNSNDGTLLHCQNLGVDRVINIESFKPGSAINTGIRHSSGDFIVILSAHCIPKDEFWLDNLISPFEDKNISAVYGRQIPLPYSSPDDTRDLLTTFGCESKIQNQDYTFHNANSAIRRSVWEKFPFSEDLSNVEDWVWAHQIIRNGLKIYYSSIASVWHYHGINQHGSNQSFRSENVSRALLEVSEIPREVPEILGMKGMNGLIVLPYRGMACKNDNFFLESVRQVKKRTNIPICVYVDGDSTLEGESGVFILKAGVCREDSLATFLQDALINYEKNNNTVLDYIYFADVMFADFRLDLMVIIIQNLFENLYSVVSIGNLDTHSFVSCSNKSTEGILNEFSCLGRKYDLVFKAGSAFRASVIRAGKLDGSRCKVIDPADSIKVKLS